MDAKHTLGEPRLLISRAALLHNVGVVRRALAPGTKLCAIVKADAYGHGGEIVADALCNFTDGVAGFDNSAVDALAVASIDEADALPDVGVPILILRPVENAFIGRQRSRLEAAVRRGWILTVCSLTAADDVARIAQACGMRARVQVMIDTGMTRSGVCTEKVSDLLAVIESRPALRLAGLCTHFASAENPDSAFTAEQLRRFRECTDSVTAEQRGRLTRHAANSAAVFFHPDSHLDMVRVGLALYGIDPTFAPSLDRALRPVLKWTAPLMGIKDVRRGESVGYAQTWTAERDTKIGLLPIGYADGYPRCFSNSASVLVQGCRAPVVGRVSMDMTTIDLGDVPGARVGDEVTLLDSDPLSPVSIYKLAKWGDTIPYEVVCRIGSRVRRVAIEPGDAAGALAPAAETDVV